MHRLQGCSARPIIRLGVFLLAAVAAHLQRRPDVAMCAQLDLNFTTLESFTEADAPDVSLFDKIIEALATALNVYYTPLLVLLGSVGNLISVFVFFKSKLRLQSTSLYLSALAISDTIFLFQLVPPWLTAIRFTGLFHRAGFCQVFVYVSYVTCFLSAWLVVAFTVERFVAVLYPLRRNMLCTVARAKHIIIGLVAAALVLNIPVIKFASPSVAADDCNIDHEYFDHAKRFNLIDTALSFTVPLTVIIVLNAWIMVGVYRIERARHQLVKTEGSARGGRGARAAPPPVTRSQHRVTRMLLIVSTVFVVLNLPAYTMRILSYAIDTSNDEYSGRWAALTQLGQMFFNTNFGINFILYCLTGQNFRRALCQAIPVLRRRARRAAALRRNSCPPARASSVSTSFVSGAEAASNCATSVSVVSNVRRQRSEPVIKRWTFDNSRHRHETTSTMPPALEMNVFVPTNSAEDTII